jgi:hypothetical protein
MNGPVECTTVPVCLSENKTISPLALFIYIAGNFKGSSCASGAKTTLLFMAFFHLVTTLTKEVYPYSFRIINFFGKNITKKTITKHIPHKHL